jgi:CheY-like chemotaxis protein
MRARPSKIRAVVRILACELVVDAASALELVDHRTFDVVVSDVVMEGMNVILMGDPATQSPP